MGLCKCPKRKVTNLFCFEHKVNVCENCMVASHDSCIIQTYLAWLSDSDFLPVCKLCEKPNTFGPCIRFPCLHIFHIDCINNRFSKLPKNTAPAGFKCPECNDKIFPSLNAGGPLAEQVKEKLKDFSWARTGLGLPLLKSSTSKTNDAPSHDIQISEIGGNNTVKQRKQVRLNEDKNMYQSFDHDKHGGNTHEINIPENTTLLGNPADPNKIYNDFGNDDQEDENSNTLNSAFRPPSSSSRTPDVDFKAFKYRRKSITQRIKRLLQNHYASQKYYEPIMGQTTPILVCLIIVVALVFIWMSTGVVRHHRNDYDPVLDPYRNPNIHTSNTKVKV